MTASISVLEKSDRVSRLKQTAALEGRSLPVRFRSKTIYLPIKRVALEIPVYRMANIRTIVRQKRAIGEKGLPDNFFKDGQENPSAQREQHLLLAKLAQDPARNIYQALRADPEQTDPLIVTQSGVVLNGNRRLAAMRELYADDPVKYGPFAYAEVAVLPEDATEGELAELETDLQIAPDLKLDYGWVETGLGLRMQLEDLGWDFARASQHWRKDPKELRALLAQLNLAEEYLRYEGHPYEYHRVAEDAYAFERLQEKHASRKAAEPSRLEAERLMVYAVVASASKVGGRVYNYAGAVEKLTDRFLQSKLVPGGADVHPMDEDDPLAKLPAGDSVIAAPALEFLRDVANSGTIAAFAEEAYEDVRDQERREVRGNRFLKDAQRINAVASGLSLEDSDLNTIGTGLSQLIAAVESISRHLNVVAKSHPDSLKDVDDEAVARAVRLIHEFGDRLKKKP